MPDIPYKKIKPEIKLPRRPSNDGPLYAELQVTSNFSFLRGASHPEELVTRAAELGLAGIALTDSNSLAGVVRAHTVARELGVEFRVGAQIELYVDRSLPHCSEIEEQEPNISLLAYPTDRASYGRLCRLITTGKLRATKGTCALAIDDLLQHVEGLVLILVPPHFSSTTRSVIHRKAVHFYGVAEKLVTALPNRELLSLALCRSYSNNDYEHFGTTRDIATALGVPLVATNDVHYHIAERKRLHDVLTCVRHRCTLDEAGFALQQNAERHLKPPSEMARLFREVPDAIARTVEILSLTKGFSLEQLRYEYPIEVTPRGESPLEYLKKLTIAGAAERFPDGIPDKVYHLLDEEFKLIEDLKYEKYFLTCHDIVRFARSRSILCQGRGAAANSVVCFCLGITAVDPTKIDLLFARFVSKERNEPPDIDIDFEHERREEVMQYIYERFGRERAGLTGAITTYRYRSAVRDVGKALGLPLATVDSLAKVIHRWTDCKIPRDDLLELGLNPDDRIIQLTLTLSSELLGFPRHLGQHVGGFIICQHPLCETVPILHSGMESRTIIEWDKDDIEALGMLKIDILALGMLTCIRKALVMVNERRIGEKQPPVALYNLPHEDSAVYDMVCRADTVGVFQIESRAQMSMLPRLKPRCFYDLVIEVAIVRPGPIQGNMVHPYLKRRAGLERPFYPDDRVREVVGKTLGVPLFQEQAMRLSIVLANFTPGEAEQLRRAMAAWKRDRGKIATFQARIITGMMANGYTKQFAETCVEQIKGFSEYGFPESHAASFALLVYASAWLKCHYPAQFCAALLNSQPMGFYAPSQLLRDAHEHGVRLLPIDINLSQWDCTIEGGNDLRVGMRLVKGLAEHDARRIVHLVRKYGPFHSVQALWSAATTHDEEIGGMLRRGALERLARADAFRSMNLPARDALWQIHSLPERSAPLDAHEDLSRRTAVVLPERSAQQDMFADYRATGVSLRAHPLQFIRRYLTSRGVITARDLRDRDRYRLRSTVSTAGIAIIRQRPGTAKGVVFITLEDETGITNMIVRPVIFERYRKLILMSRCLLATGTLERIDTVIYINTESIEDLDDLIKTPPGQELSTKSYSY